MTNEERAHALAMVAAEYTGRGNVNTVDVASKIAKAYGETYKFAIEMARRAPKPERQEESLPAMTEIRKGDWPCGAIPVRFGDTISTCEHHKRRK